MLGQVLGAGAGEAERPELSGVWLWDQRVREERLPPEAKRCRDQRKRGASAGNVSQRGGHGRAAPARPQEL